MALSKTCSRKGTLQRYYCSIYGTAKQVAVYGGLNLGPEWNVLLFVRTYNSIIKGMVLYRHSFLEELSPIYGSSQTFEASSPPLQLLVSSTAAVVLTIPYCSRRDSSGWELEHASGCGIRRSRAHTMNSLDTANHLTTRRFIQLIKVGHAVTKQIW